MEQPEYAVEIIYLVSVIKRQEEMGSGIIGGRLNKHGFNTLVLKEVCWDGLVPQRRNKVQIAKQICEERMNASKGRKRLRKLLQKKLMQSSKK